MGDRSNYLPIATATAAACSLAAVYWHQKKNKNDSLRPDEVKADLLEIEQTLAGGGGGDNAMSSLTWFKGDTTAATLLLKERAQTLLEANPWLAGRVRKHEGKHALIYTETPQNANEYFHVVPNLISRDVPLSQLGIDLKDYLLKTGATEPLWRVAIYPCAKNPTNQFAVVVTLSHVIGDGHTFYKLQNMLFGSTEMESLVVERNFETKQQQIKAMGGAAEQRILSSGGFLVNVIAGVLQAAVQKSKYKASSRIYLLDPEGMAKAKQEALKDTNTKFVSSNDVLTSWFFQNCNCVHGFMALNFRGRLENHTDRQAGNYENVVFYRRPDSAHPALLRQSISGQVYRRQITSDIPMPGFWEMARGANIAICTNWASFALPCKLEGCEEEIQIPLYNVSALLPSTMAVGIVFRAGPKGLAVLVAGSPDKLKGLEAKVPFLKPEELVN